MVSHAAARIATSAPFVHQTDCHSRFQLRGASHGNRCLTRKWKAAPGPKRMTGLRYSR